MRMPFRPGTLTLAFSLALLAATPQLSKASLILFDDSAGDPTPAALTDTVPGGYPNGTSYSFPAYQYAYQYIPFITGATSAEITQVATGDSVVTQGNSNVYAGLYDTNYSDSVNPTLVNDEFYITNEASGPNGIIGIAFTGSDSAAQLANYSNPCSNIVAGCYAETGSTQTVYVIDWMDSGNNVIGTTDIEFIPDQALGSAPEPGTIAMSLGGLALLAVRRLRRKN